MRQDSITQRDAVFGGLARPGFVAQSGNAVRGKAAAPLSDRIRPYPDLPGNFVIAPPLQASDHDARPLGKANLPTSTSGQALKLGHHLLRTRQRYRNPCHHAPDIHAIGAS